jgi:hypothetical protein
MLRPVVEVDPGPEDVVVLVEIVDVVVVPGRH